MSGSAPWMPFGHQQRGLSSGFTADAMGERPSRAAVGAVRGLLQRPRHPAEGGIEQVGRLIAHAARVEDRPAEAVALGFVADGADPAVIVLSGRSAGDDGVARVQAWGPAFREAGTAKFTPAEQTGSRPASVSL